MIGRCPECGADAEILIGDVITINCRGLPASVGTHPEGQDGEAGLVRSMGDAVPKADAQTPSPITPNGA